MGTEDTIGRSWLICGQQSTGASVKNTRGQNKDKRHEHPVHMYHGILFFPGLESHGKARNQTWKQELMTLPRAK